MVPRMRTIDQAAAWLLENDPGCALTKTALRRMVTSGEIPATKTGQKYLINLDVLERYLSGTINRPIPIQSGIRKIAP